MIVMVLESVPTSVRGELTRWLLELKAGVFIGDVSAMVRDALWTDVTERLRGGWGMLIHSADNEQGFAVRYAGPTTRAIEDYEGLILVRTPQ